MKILQKDLAKAAGVSSSAVTLWLQGTTEQLKAASLFGLAKYLKVRVEWLWNEEGPMRAAGTTLHGAGPRDGAPTTAPVRDDSLSREAVKLVGLIAHADHEKAVPKETLRAFSVIFAATVGQSNRGATPDLAAAQRDAEAQFEERQSKPRRRKKAL
ncbi:helix-turn-helix domain-containing protein [Caballeronia sp. dw_19]|uniref:helix-turn-helix domain-containing protein n=1 Tax=Caballeronia sp. dw_19 TaxID=2719791 RepID=UPI001BCDF9D6|nr:helix-turn-helix domain-containing protein [Caballeronia sp. dw_19]